MPRRLELHTREMGRVQLYLIYDVKGTWEESWRALQGHPAASAFTFVSKEIIDHALHGWTEPFVKALGPPPSGAIRKLPIAAKECGRRGSCSIYDKRDCLPTAKAMPWCYEPGGVEGEAKGLVAEAIGLWREGVYVTVVREDQ